MTSTATAAAAPAYIARTDYAGRWQIAKAAPKIGYCPAGKLHELVGAEVGEEYSIWEYSGQTRDGRHLFTRERCITGTDGRVYEYDAFGGLVLIHPADRRIRFYSK